jgi:hypothetical protein
MLCAAAVVMLQVLLLHDEESWVRGSAAAALSHLAMGGYAGMQSRIGQTPGAITALVQVCAVLCCCLLQLLLAASVSYGQWLAVVVWSLV